MANIERKRIEEREIIEVSGKLGIEDAGRLASELRGACDGGREVIIDLRQARSCDLACLQVLCAAHRTHGHSPGGICMRASLSPAVTEMLKLVGVEPQLCGANISSSCLWKQGEENGQRDLKRG